jgi:DNA invertase Pin-like site-specific DNA recombinase
MIKAFGYLRVSGKGQIDGDGFIRQEKTIEKYAKDNGIEVYHIYRDEGVSGTLMNRPALIEMLVDLEENGNGVKTVIVEKMDRLARDLLIQETIISDFREKGISLISAVEGSDLLDVDPTRQLVRQVLGAISEYEKTMLVQKLRVARQRKKAKTGKAWWRALEIACIKDFHFHDLRHTFCSNLILSGAGLKDVKEMIGHSDISMTDRYSHLTLAHKLHKQEQLAEHYVNGS